MPLTGEAKRLYNQQHYRKNLGKQRNSVQTLQKCSSPRVHTVQTSPIASPSLVKHPTGSDRKKQIEFRPAVRPEVGSSVITPAMPSPFTLFIPVAVTAPSKPAHVSRMSQQDDPATH